MKHKSITTDVVVIGSGLAGLTTALEAAKTKQVLIISKTKLQNSNSHYAQGGIAAVLSKTDTFVKHINDTFEAGDWHNTPRAVTALVKESPNAIHYLESMGVKFDVTKNGEYALAQEGGHSKRRIVHVKDETGKAIVKALLNKVKHHPSIAVLDQAHVISLLRSKTRVGGVVLEQLNTNTRIHIQAKHTVLASGGVGALYSYTTNPDIAVGDGIALALQAGAKVKDLEFIQFHPTTLNEPGKPHFLLSEALRGEGATLVHANGRRFMKRYHKLGELAPRDIVSRAVYLEMQKQPVFLDARPIGKTLIAQHFPGISKQLTKYGLSLTKQPIPITPTAHYLCGGITTNLNGETTVPGLYAVGEVAYTGSQGANRLASNSLLECVVYGLRLGNALAHKKSSSQKAIQYTNPGYHLPLTDANYTIQHQDIQQIMWHQVGIIRSNEGLKLATTALQDIQKQATSIRILLEATTALAITMAAKKRKHSLGAHYRES